jgi:hypothetical protein
MDIVACLLAPWSSGSGLNAQQSRSMPALELVETKAIQMYFPEA